MPLLWISVLVVLLRWLEVGPVADLSWWWVLSPLGLCWLWFETFERLFGRDKRQLEAAAHEKLRKERIAEQFTQTLPRRR